MPSITILIADDNEAGRYLAARLLAREGFRVVEAGSGQEVLELARHGVDLVLLDIHLPGIDGLQVCRELKADPATRQVLVLHSSATLDPEARSAAAASGGDDYIDQPFTGPELAARVNALLTQRKPGRAG